MKEGFILPDEKPKRLSMTKLLSYYRNNNKTIFILVLLTAFYLLLQLSYVTKIPNVMVDEPWYANVAYNFANGRGLVNTNPGSGGGTGVFLYTLLMGLFFKIFGTSLFTARLFSVAAGLLGLFGLVCILVEVKARGKIIFFCTLFYVFSNVNYIIFRSVRPEGWSLTFIIWGLYFLISGINSGNDFKWFFSGLFVSASFLCHPNGALYVFLFGIVGLTHSFQTKKVQFFLYYLLGCSLVFVSFFLHIIYFRREDVVSYIGNWSSRTSVSSSDFLASIWQNIATFFKTYTLGIKRLFIFIFELGILIVGLFHYKNRVLFITCLIGLCYFVLAIIFLKPFATRHFGEVLIFSIISYSLILQESETRKKTYKLYLIMGAIYLFNNIAGDLYVIYRDYGHTPYSYIEEKVDVIVPDETKLLTLMHFWFPLKNNKNYNSYTRWRNKNYDSLDGFISSGDADYVVISDYLTRGTTATSGRHVNCAKHKQYYEKVHNYAVENGCLIDAVRSDNYGKIEIWRLR